MKYKINRDQPPLTDGELASARNFNQIVKGYRTMKIPFYKSGKFLTRGSAIIVAVAVALIVLFDDKAETPREFISPPLAHVVIPTDTFIVDADSATDITYKSGSKLHIPAGAFRDLKGNPVKGKVNLNYREFHDQKDIFLSGIPMTYDSAGSTYVFESAGMMEISASQSGKPLATNADKTISVDMVSNTREDRYNTYYLDTADKKWVNLNQANLDPKQAGISTSLFGDSASPDRPVKELADPVVIKCEEELKQTTAAVKTIEKEKPMPIAKADKDKTKFHIVVDAGEFPEIAMYKGVRFQVKDEKNFNPGSAKTEWENVKLKKLTGIDYEVTFTKGEKTLKVVATPVVDGQDLAAAEKVYDQKFAEYQTKLADKKNAEENAKKEMERIMADQRLRDSVYESHLTKTQLIYRTISVNYFGIYNCDCIGISPFSADIAATFTDEDGKTLNCTVLNLVEKNSLTLYPFYPKNGECKHFRFSPKGNEMLWGVTDDNKLAIIDAKSFKSQQATIGKVQFRFKVIDKDFKSSDEVKKYLEI